MQIPSSRKIVLCVDDEEVVLRLLQVTLSAHGYAVLTTYNGTEALRLAAARQPDAVVLDYSMPAMNGAELATKIKAIHPGTAVVMFSGLSHLRSSMPNQIDAFVDKDEGLDVLLRVLHRLLQMPGEKANLYRRFPRTTAQLPIAVLVNRAGSLALLRGVTTTIGEGGLGGVIEGDLIPGELVLMQFLDPRLGKLESRAQVRYRQSEVCGFEFLDISPTQRDEVRRFCQQEALA